MTRDLVLRSVIFTISLLALIISTGCVSSASRGMSDLPAIRVNQIGFYPDGPKIAVVVNSAAEEFRVVNETGEEVYRGSLGTERVWAYSGERARLAEFSGLSDVGSYRIMLDDGTTSPTFAIGDGIHGELARAALKAFYFQRASTELTAEFAGLWARPAGHPDSSVAIHASAASPQRPEGTIISAPYGWYDAGDYNKYIVNSGISTYQILAMYEHFPGAARMLTVRIPETGGRLADVLAEALWNLRWMLAMQDPHDGGVYHKLTTARFEEAVMPHEAVAQRYVVQKSVTAALNFAAVMAQASRIFAEYVPELADSMQTATLAAWGWARANPDALYDQADMNRRFEP
jgi:endoglucanase